MIRTMLVCRVGNRSASGFGLRLPRTNRNHSFRPTSSDQVTSNHQSLSYRNRIRGRNDVSAILLPVVIALGVLIALDLIFPSATIVAAPEIPGQTPTQPILLVGATIHPITGEPIEDGQLLMDQGRIVAVAQRVEVPQDVQRIDVTGKHVYPGLFDAYTNMGLIEINAVRATNDLSESGLLNPNVRAEVAFNPDSELIPVARSEGVLLCLTAPRGELIAGRSAILRLDGWSQQEMTLRSDVGMHIQWPNMMSANQWWIEKSTAEQIDERNERLEQLERFTVNARAYDQAQSGKTHQENTRRGQTDVRYEAMQSVWNREIPLIVHANEIQQIQAAVAYAVRQRVRLVLLGGYDAPHCADLLRKHDVSVIVAGVYRLPRRRSDDFDAPFTLPERLRQAEIRFCISGYNRFGPSNTRNLPYHAAMAVAFGLAPQEAIKSITLYPAEILGVADQVGSLEPGKEATLIVTNGDPLEATTHVEKAFIEGRPVDLNNRHKRLWRKYQEKYRQLGSVDGSH